MKKLLLIEKLHQFLALIFILSFIIYYFWSPFWFGLLWFGLINLILIAIYIPTLFIKMGIERINYFEDFKSFFSEEEIKTNNKITIETEAESIKKTFIQSIITIIGLFTWIIFPLISPSRSGDGQPFLWSVLEILLLGAIAPSLQLGLCFFRSMFLIFGVRNRVLHAILGSRR